MSGARRWRGTDVPPAQAAPTTPPALIQRRRPMVALARRTRAAVAPPTVASAPTNPAFTDWTRRRLSLRLPKLPRGRLIETVWGQAAANTNQPLIAFITLARRRFLWQRRARVAEGWWPQQAAAVNPAFTDWIKRRVLIRTWPLAVRARKSEAPVPQAAGPVNPAFVAPSPYRRRVVAIWVRRARPAETARPAADLVAIPTTRRPRSLPSRRARLASLISGQDQGPAASLRRRSPIVQRRRPLLLGFVPAQVVLPNPAITEFIRVPNRIRQWLRQRAGRLFSPGWGQASGVGLASSGVSMAAVNTAGQSQGTINSAGVSWLTANTVVVAQSAPSAGASVAAVNTVGISYVPLY